MLNEDSQITKKATETTSSTNTEQDVDQSLSYLEAIWKTTKPSLATVASYTYSYHLSIVLGGFGGHLGGKEDEETYLGAVILASATLNTVLILSVSPYFAIGPHVITQLGLKKNVSAVLKQAALIGLPIALISIFPFIYSKKMLRALGQNKDTVELAATYLEPVAVIVPASLLRLAAEQILFAFGKQTAVMQMALSSFAIGTTVAYVLAFGKMGAPKYGLAGLAYGLIIETYLTAGLFCLYLHKHPSLNQYKFFEAFKTLTAEDLKQIKSILNVSFPIAVTYASELGANFVLALLAGLLGKNALAAYNIAEQFKIFTTIPPIAFGQTTYLLVSGAIANQQFKKAAQLARGGMISSVGVITPICLLLAIDPTIAEKIFSNSEDVEDDTLETARILVQITAFAVMADALRFNILSVLRGTDMDDGKKATLIANIAIWVGVALAYLLGNLTSLDILGIVMGYEISAFVVGGAVLLPRWHESIKTENLKDKFNSLEIKSSAVNETAPNLSINSDVVLTEDTSLLTQMPGTAKRSDWSCTLS